MEKSLLKSDSIADIVILSCKNSPKIVLYSITLALGPVAQRSEQVTHNHLVRGPNPCGPSELGRLAQLVRALRSHRKG